MDAYAASPPRRYRAIWISDIHLGTPGCKADLLLDFLKSTESEYLYLVGDIIDVWRLKRSWFWRQTHNDVVQKLLRKARKGTRLIYIPGNHDEAFRDFAGHRFGRVAVLREAVHRTADGKRLLVIHGDQFDGVVKYARWLAVLGDNAYAFALWLNTGLNGIRRRLGFQYWSLSAYLKHKVKDAVEFVTHFNHAVIGEAKRRGLDGVVCGHIHTPEITSIDGMLYCNDGDWVETCSALVEHHDGRLEVVRWIGAEQFPDSEPTFKETPCESSSSPMPGFLKSMVSFARSAR